MVLRKGWVKVVGFSLRIIRGGPMANILASDSAPSSTVSLPNAREGKKHQRSGNTRTRFVFLAAAVLLVPLLFAQSTPQVAGVEPSSGKVNDSITLTGQNLGKESVSAVYLSDDKNDFKAAVVEQSAEKIVVKVPQVKSGRYNISIQVGDKLFIKPVRFTVDE
jgi:hypothetical protein